jgi:hypothetical protein
MIRGALGVNRETLLVYRQTRSDGKPEWNVIALSGAVI